MKVFVSSSERVVSPWNEPVSEIQILGRSLADLMSEEFERAGLTPVTSPPVDEVYLLVSDRTWVTSAALQAFLECAEAGQQFLVEHPLWLEMTGALQEWKSVGLYEVALMPAGAAPMFEDLTPVVVDLKIDERDAPPEHPALAHAMPEKLPFTDACVHQIDHWTHVLRANWMGISSTFAREGRAFARKNIVAKAIGFLWLLLKTRSFSRWRFARSLSQIPKSANIHPTAVVELSVIGEGAEIGPYAVIRGSVIGEGVKIEEHAVVNASVLGAKARVGKRGTANLSVLYPEAFISAGAGHQACVFGRQCFVAWGVTTFDLSFGEPIKVRQNDQRVSSETHFLGAAIGHRARIGGEVSLGYGAEIPNDATVVGHAERVLRHWEDGPSPHRVVDGVARSVQKKD